MGTRADFYIGIGPEAEWLGSIAWDGYEFAEDEENPIYDAKDEESYRNAINDLLSHREDATRPEDGWPWPWDDSNTTDYTYSFYDGKVKHWVFDSPDEGWPNMKDRKNVAFDNRSGVIFVTKN